MADPPDVKLVATGPYGEVYLARGADSHKQWSELDVSERVKLEQRFRAACHASGPLPKEKLRPVKNSDGILEFKITKPGLRALAFKEGGSGMTRWFVTHIIRKPKPRRLPAEAKKAEQAREQHYDR